MSNTKLPLVDVGVAAHPGQDPYLSVQIESDAGGVILRGADAEQLAWACISACAQIAPGREMEAAKALPAIFEALWKVAECRDIEPMTCHIEDVECENALVRALDAIPKP